MFISICRRILLSILAGALFMAPPAPAQTNTARALTPFDISEFSGTLEELEALIPSMLPSTTESERRPPDSSVTERGYGGAPPCEDRAFNSNSRPRMLLERYWSSRQSLREHFVRNAMDAEGNLTGDGIGS